MSNYKSMKFKVNNPEHSEQIQECLFKLGYVWNDTHAPVVNWTEKNYITTYDDGIIFYSTYTFNFDTETTLEELQAMLGDFVPEFRSCGHLEGCPHHGVVPASACPCECSNTAKMLQEPTHKQEPTSDPIPEHNIDNTMTQFLNQLQKRLALAELTVYISSNEIQVSDLGSDQLARVESYEELIKAIEVKEQFMNMFKEI